jgi:hypothetical protein
MSWRRQFNTGQGITSTGFTRWDDVLAYVRKHGLIGYHAPLDHKPAMAQARVGERCPGAVTPEEQPANVSRLVHIFVPPSDGDSFYADEGHIDRFRKLEGKP